VNKRCARRRTVERRAMKAAAAAREGV